jgi:type IV secretory pathway VirJ component
MLSLILMMQAANAAVPAVKNADVQNARTYENTADGIELKDSDGKVIGLAKACLVRMRHVVTPFENSPLAWAEANAASQAVSKAEAEVAAEEMTKAPNPKEGVDDKDKIVRKPKQYNVTDCSTDKHVVQHAKDGRSQFAGN